MSSKTVTEAIEKLAKKLGANEEEIEASKTKADAIDLVSQYVGDGIKSTPEYAELYASGQKYNESTGETEEFRNSIKVDKNGAFVNESPIITESTLSSALNKIVGIAEDEEY